jgi:hypothetical protein
MMGYEGCPGGAALSGELQERESRGNSKRQEGWQRYVASYHALILA